MKQTSYQTFIPIDSPVYDYSIENYVRFVQGTNAFVAVFGLLEIIRNMFLYSTHSEQCSTQSRAFIILAIMNVFWVTISWIGIRSINSKQSNNVNRFLILLLLFAIPKLIFYLYMDGIMTRDQAYTSSQCETIYQREIYMLIAILEGTVIGVIIFMTRGIKNYIKSWEDGLF